MSSDGFWITHNGKKVHIQGNRLMSDEDLEIIQKMIEEATKERKIDKCSDQEPEYSMECSMCGKETPHRKCGMCTHCEQVWNS